MPNLEMNGHKFVEEPPSSICQQNEHILSAMTSSQGISVGEVDMIKSIDRNMSTRQTLKKRTSASEIGDDRYDDVPIAEVGKRKKITFDVPSSPKGKDVEKSSSKSKSIAAISAVKKNIPCSPKGKSLVALSAAKKNVSCSPKGKDVGKMSSKNKSLSTAKKSVKQVESSKEDPKNLYLYKKSGCRKLASACQYSVFQNLIENLRPCQKQRIQSIGFGGLLEFKVASLGRKMNDWLVNNFNPGSCMFSCGNGKEFVFTANDVHDILCLPRNEGNNVPEFGIYKKNKNEEFESLKIRLKTFLGLGHDAVVKRNHICSKVLEMEDASDEFLIVFVICAVSLFLAPKANQFVDLKILKALSNVEHISSYDWCSFVLEKLCDGIKSCRENPDFLYVTGCLIVLQIGYFHHLEFRGLKLPKTLPLIQHWDSCSVDKRIEDEKAASSFGLGKIVKNIFPICGKNVCLNHLVVLSSQIDSGVVHDAANVEQLQILSNNGVKDAVMEFKKDLDTIYNRHVSKLISIKTRTMEAMSFEQRAAATSSVSPAVTDSQEFFSNPDVLNHIDRVVDGFFKFKKVSSDMPSFDLLTPSPSVPKGVDVANFDKQKTVKDSIDHDKVISDVVGSLREEIRQGKRVADSLVCDDDSDETGETFHSNESYLIHDPVGGRRNERRKRGGDHDLDEVQNREQVSAGIQDDVLGEGRNREEDGRDVVAVGAIPDAGKKVSEDDNVLHEGQNTKESEKHDGKDKTAEHDVLDEDQNREETEKDVPGGDFVIDQLEHEGQEVINESLCNVLVSSFTKANRKLFQSKFPPDSLEVIDYCFYDGEGIDSSETLVLFRGEYLIPKEDFFTLFYRQQISTRIVEGYFILLNYKELKKEKPVLRKRFFFGTHHMESLEKVIDLSSNLLNFDLLKTAREALFQCLEAWLKVQHPECTISSCDMFFLPFLVGDHYFLCVYDIKKHHMFLIDNRDDASCLPYYQLLCEYGRRELSVFFTKKHPLAESINKCTFIEFVTLWQSNKSDNDCGVYLIKHMEHFNGINFDCGLKNAVTRRFFRASICCDLVTTEFNDVRESIMHKVVQFRPNKSKILKDEAQQKKEKYKKKKAK